MRRNGMKREVAGIYPGNFRGQLSDNRTTGQMAALKI
jgi:hypothetical protein